MTAGGSAVGHLVFVIFNKFKCFSCFTLNFCGTSYPVQEEKWLCEPNSAQNIINLSRRVLKEKKNHDKFEYNYFIIQRHSLIYMKLNYFLK